ncbi:hypothetical protein GCM10023196_080020 [Actinoallomurus vinaceus]|uniref:Uncharacterized protein n=1 Tax=Actinoallomurus vinaceus TaxID=1080074 RepID=A0ABP8UMG1_9ACTN
MVQANMVAAAATTALERCFNVAFLILDGGCLHRERCRPAGGMFPAGAKRHGRRYSLKINFASKIDS